MNDQKAMWDQKHSVDETLRLGTQPNVFARSVGPQLRPGQKLLELGCCIGVDASYFASLGTIVTATDFSDVIIQKNQARTTGGNPQFEVLDISQLFPYEDGAFDAVYSHLALHYYDDAETRAIFAEIARVLKPGGTLYFNCKSPRDPMYGDGNQIAPDIFDRNGHLRHFFSSEYTKDVLAKAFDIVKLEETQGIYDTVQCAFIDCWAKKRGV